MNIILRHVAIAWYHDGSGLLGAYGPWNTAQEAADAAEKLREMGVYRNERWDILPCWGNDND